MRSLISFGLRHAVAMNLVFIGLVIYAAAVALPSLPVEIFPNMAFGEAQIRTDYPGATPEDVERLVTRPLEDAIRGMDDIEFVRSDSHAGFSTLQVKFLDDSDYRRLYDELRLRVLAVQNRLPVVYGKPLTPVFMEVEVDAWLPVIQYNVLAGDDRIDHRALHLVARSLRDRIELVDGVRATVMIGERPQQFELALDPARLERHALSYAAVVQALRATGQALPAGIHEGVDGERHLRVDDRHRSIEDLLASPVVHRGDGHVVTVGDLVDAAHSGVRDIPGRIRVSVDGRPAIGIQVRKHPWADAREVIGRLDPVVDSFLASHAADGIAVVRTMDSTIQIGDSMEVLGSSLYLAAVWVMVALFAFLSRRHPLLLAAGLVGGLVVSVIGAVGSPVLVQTLALAGLTVFIFVTCRASVLTAAGIAFSFLGTLVFFHATGRSINEISLLGFVLTCGIIVDDAIVVLENIQRHREHGASMATAAREGAAEVFWPVVSATLTTCCAFLPLLLMTGAIGQFFAIIPITVSIALAISLIECLLLLPLHSVELDRLLGPERIETVVGDESDHRVLLARQGLGGGLTRAYDRVLRWNLDHRWLSIGAAVLLFLLALGVLVQSLEGPRLVPGMKPLLRFEFFPENTGVFNINLYAPPGTSLAETDALVREVATAVSSRPRDEVAASTGLAGMMWDEAYREQYSHQHGFFFIELPPRAQRRYDDPLRFLAELRADLEERFADRGIRLLLRPMQDGPPTGAAINVRVTGPDEDQVEALAMELHAWMLAEAEGALEGITHDRTLFHDEIELRVDRQAAVRLDLAPAMVQDFAAGAFAGLWVGDLLRSDDEIPIQLRLSPQAVDDPAALLGTALVDDPGGRVVRFADVGQLLARTRPSVLTRRDYQRMITITAGMRDDSRLSATHINAAIRDWYAARAAAHPGATIAFGGETEATGKSYRSLGVAFLVGLFLVYAVLAIQFNSYLQPLLIISNVFFSFTGVLLVMGVSAALFRILPGDFIREQRFWFTINSLIAIVGLTGLVVNDAIVLIDFINRRRIDGLPTRQAILLAAHQRLRPIIMTTLTTIAGLLPMAIGIPYFSIQWSPFATCFVAGLATSTTMTLLIMPVLYETLEDLRRRLSRDETY